jgi:uroporphyrinogen-III synthase
VRSFVDAAGVDAVPRVVVCIGPVTAEAATSAGLRVAAVPNEHTVPAMLVALAEALAEGSRSPGP